MLKNLKVRTKLAVVLAVPLLALLAIGAIGALDRRSEATDARHGKQLAELLAARVELAHQLQIERVWASTGSTATAAARARLAANTDTLAAARAAYAERAAAAHDIDPTLRAALDEAATQLTALDTARAAITETSAAPVAAYDTALDALRRVGVDAARAESGSATAARDKASMVELAAVKDTLAQLSARATAAIGANTPASGLDALRQQNLLLAQQERTFRAAAGATATAEYDARTSTPEVTAAVAQMAAYLSTGTDRVTPSDLTAWTNAIAARLTALRQVEAVLTNDVGSAAATAENDAVAEARNFALVLAGAVLLSLLLASLVARSIAKPLTTLTRAANTLADERLPALVDQMRNPSDAAPAERVEMPESSKSEIGQLARALTSIQDVTHTVADEQATLLRKGIGDIFVNLARRNQTLLDRQIEFIDQLEAAEEDPDLLENLFRLDHLATRMRRNAESLLVLAGAEPPRRRGRPVDITDVVRVAVGEVEHFARVQLLALDDATVAGGVAVDLAHLLSELMENATHFSPPDTRVEVVGQRSREGDYQLLVTDQGIGMNADQLIDANRTIANPPNVGLTISRSLGFTVIGRLAQRHGLAVRLGPSPTGGVAASVLVPASLIDPTATSRGAAPADQGAAEPATMPAATDLALFAPQSRPTATPGDISDLFEVPAAPAALDLGQAPAPDAPTAAPGSATAVDRPPVPDALPIPPAPEAAAPPAPEAVPVPPAPEAVPVPPAPDAAAPPAPEALPVPAPEAAAPPAPPIPPAASVVPPAPPVEPLAPPAAMAPPPPPPSAPLPPPPPSAPVPPATAVPASTGIAPPPRLRPPVPPTAPPAPPAEPVPAPATAGAPTAPPRPPAPPSAPNVGEPPAVRPGAATPPLQAPAGPPPAGAVPPPMPSRAPSTAPASAPDLPPVRRVPAEQTAADAAPGAAFEGLTRRVPRADAAAPRPAAATARATQRSPEEVRQMLSRYRSGLKRGRSEDDPTPPEPTS